MVWQPGTQMKSPQKFPRQTIKSVPLELLTYTLYNATIPSQFLSPNIIASSWEDHQLLSGLHSAVKHVVIKEASGGIKRHQEAPRGIERHQEPSRAIKRHQEASRGIKRF